MGESGDEQDGKGGGNHADADGNGYRWSLFDGRFIYMSRGHESGGEEALRFLT